MDSSKEIFVKELYQHQGLIHKICGIYRDSKEDREDLFQEITFQLWKSYPQFQGNSKLSSWIYRIGLNTAMATFRKPKIIISDTDNFENLALADSHSENDRQEKLFLIIKKLEEGERAIIALYLEDMSYAEIAEIIGISENNVGVRLNRIKNKMRNILNK